VNGPTDLVSLILWLLVILFAVAVVQAVRRR
jgi:hypothetical protein